MLDGRSSARRNSATRAMSIRASGWVRRRLSIGPRVCPPARYFASPSAAAKILKASSRVSAREYEKGAGFTSALPHGNALAVFRDVDRPPPPPWRYRDRSSVVSDRMGSVRLELGG